MFTAFFVFAYQSKYFKHGFKFLIEYYNQELTIGKYELGEFEEVVKLTVEVLYGEAKKTRHQL